jgi:hypothetical protein
MDKEVNQRKAKRMIFPTLEKTYSEIVVAEIDLLESSAYAVRLNLDKTKTVFVRSMYAFQIDKRRVVYATVYVEEHIAYAKDVEAYIDSRGAWFFSYGKRECLPPVHLTN